MKETNQIILQHLAMLAGYKNITHFISVTDEWSDILRTIIRPTDQKIVEFGSGVSPKIQFALSDMNYEGTLLLVDYDEKALNIQSFIHSKLRPHFKVEYRHGDLYETPIDNLDIIVGNHLIDDLIAADFATKYSIQYEIVFRDSAKQIRFWEQVIKEEESAERTIERFAEKLIEVRPKTKIIINHYSANFDSKYDIFSRDIICYKMLDKLQKCLETNNFSELSVHVGSMKENEQWLFFQKD